MFKNAHGSAICNSPKRNTAKMSMNSRMYKYALLLKYYIVIIRNSLLLHTTWISLTNIILRKKSIHNNKYVIQHTWISKSGGLIYVVKIMVAFVLECGKIKLEGHKRAFPVQIMVYFFTLVVMS